ncbi:VOC family protein [Roseomonas sp. 18066]|uniref:VOC family protein n=1 Tax=Roseomonas sp. 18066 TaxID=2681412 RepID=UPI001357FC04|nr:VOC family protein [Roseomonas sp. 18066]
MRINAYLLFDGDCEAAFTLYAQVLGGRILAMMRHAGSPAEDQVPAEWRDKILHACLEVEGLQLMASDAPPGRFQPQQGFSINIAVRSVAEAERVFAGLSDGGQVGMPLQRTFWAERFGMLTDRFGTPWMVNFSEQDCEP